MTTLDRESIGRKLIGMTRRLDRLANYQSLTFEEYLQDEDRQATIERYLEIIIQAALDINRALIKSASEVKVEDLKNAETFSLAGELGFISSEVANQLIPSARFRNVLAHAYDEVLPELSYQALQVAVVQYQQYVQEIQTYLNSLQDD